MRSLAYLARAWAAMLALLFAKRTCDHLRLLSIQITSWIIWPSRDTSPLLKLKAVMIAWLSPSRTSFVNPHSNANSTARRQANISASSLHATGGPFVDKDAMTSPLSLRIMAPIPDVICIHIIETHIIFLLLVVVSHNYYITCWQLVWEFNLNAITGDTKIMQ